MSEPGRVVETVGAGEDARPRSLAPGAVTLWRLTTLARGAALGAAALAVDLLIDLPGRFGGLAAAVGILALGAAVVVPSWRYRAWRFALRERELFLRRGVLFRTTSIVPHARIQHVDTRHGPIDRWLGLASVVVFTAGTRGAVLSIPALEADEAERIRDRLAALSGAGDAV